MDLSSSSASTLARPRITLAVITAAAAVSVGVYLIREARLAASGPINLEGQRLHRSNAVRRPRQTGDPHRFHTHPEHPEHHEHVALNDASTTDPESHADENAEVNTALRLPPDGAETVAEEATEDNWWDDPNQSPQRAGQNIVSLLFRVSEDNARRNAYVHRGCACNACGILPIRGIRYRCANCADFDLCETCESQGLHIKTHIFYKVKIPAPPFGPRQMQPVWYPGDPDTCLRNLPRHLMSKLSKETGFERPELEAFWEQWTFMANNEWREDPDDLGVAMDRKTFERCLVPSGGYRHTAPNLIHDRMFAFYDTNNDDLIGFTEFLHGLSYRKRKDKLRKIFDGYDVDKDGFVDRRDFLRIFRAYYVLYKQMYKDILEGLDDQVMSSTEAHQLVSSRQPLSSLFGREGRVPEADHERPTTEGKLFRDDGDVMVNDGNVGVVYDDRPDTSNREEILTGLYTRSNGRRRLFSDNSFSPGHPQSPNMESESQYWDALLNPPTTVEELPRLLTGESETRVLDEIFAANGDEERQENGNETEESGHSGDDQISPQNGDLATAHDPDESEQPDGAAPRPEDRLERRVGNEHWNHMVPTESEIRARHQQIMAAKHHRANLRKDARVAARKTLHERWKRRQFYLDEEEGATPPSGWEDEEDVLMHANGRAEASKAAQHHALSPRSRSSSKVRFAEDTDDYETRSNHSASTRSVPERWGGMDIPDAERDAGKEILYQVTQQAFNELLDILFKDKEDMAIRAAETKDARDRHRPLFQSLDVAEVAEGEATMNDETESVDGLPELDGIEDIISISIANDLPDDVVEFISPRDFTWPQFRPNSLLEILVPGAVPGAALAGSDSDPSSVGIATPILDASSSASDDKEHNGGEAAPKAKTSSEPKEAATPTPIPPSTLREWKRIDLAEQEAMERGGWGKLSYAEFEPIYRHEESRSNRLDYLGSWIDFCIP